MDSEQDDIVVASTTSTQAELDHAAGDDWRVSPEPVAPVTEEKKEEVKEDPSPSEEDETAAESETAKPESDSKVPPKGETRAQKRERELIRDRDYARQRAQEIEAESKERERKLEERLAKLEQGAAKPAAKADEDPEPKLEDFANQENGYDKWVKAQSRWDARQVVKETVANQQKAAEEADAAEEQRVEQENTKKTFDAYNAQVDKTREKHPDWDDVIKAGADVPMSQGVQLAVIESENGPEVAYYLCTHKDEAKALNTMSVPRAMVEIGKISAKLLKADDAPSPERKPVTSAAAPLRPVGRAGTTSSVPLDTLSYEDYRRVRDEATRNR